MKSTNYYNYDPNRAAVLTQKKCGSKEPGKMHGRALDRRNAGRNVRARVDSKCLSGKVLEKIYQRDVHTTSVQR